MTVGVDDERDGKAWNSSAGAAASVGCDTVGASHVAGEDGPAANHRSAASGA